MGEESGLLGTGSHISLWLVIMYLCLYLFFPIISTHFESNVSKQCSLHIDLAHKILWRDISQTSRVPLLHPHRKTYTELFSKALCFRAKIYRKPCFINSISHQTACFITSLHQKKCFLLQWSTGNSFRVVSLWARFSVALQNHVCRKEVSISEVGYSEEPVPNYYPLMCSLIGRFFKKGHFPSPGLYRN